MPGMGEDRDALIDFSSDVITTPTEAMWEAMRSTKLGWASKGSDPVVNALEEMAARITGKEAALFVITGSLGNLLALFTHAHRGDQVILEEFTHVLWSEEWGIATICGLLPRPIPGTFGALDPVAVESAITGSHYGHLPPTGLVCLENTHDASGGAALTPAQTRVVCDVAHHYGVPVHLDGSRVFNAAVALGVDVKALVEPVDSVMFSLSKGLSAPMGALLCGSRRLVEEARHNCRVLGAGSIHKSGMAAAAGIVALTTMIDRLAEDNARARMLAEALSRVEGIRVDLERVQTNMVLVDVTDSGWTGEAFLAELAKRRVRAYLRDGNLLRLVTHRHIGDGEVKAAVEAFRQAATARGRQPV